MKQNEKNSEKPQKLTQEELEQVSGGTHWGYGRHS